MKKQATGFLDFVREQGVIGLAIGLIIGAGAKEVVDSFVKGFIDPVIALLVPGAESLSEATFKFSGKVFAWGNFVSVSIRFLIIVALVYFIISKLAKSLDKPKS